MIEWERLISGAGDLIFNSLFPELYKMAPDQNEFDSDEWLREHRTRAKVSSGYRRTLVREAGRAKFNSLQARVQSPHGAIDYASHVHYYRANPNHRPALYGFELEIEKSPKYNTLKILLDRTLGEQAYYVTTDGSLRDSGLEIISLPFPRSEWTQKYSRLHKLLTELSKNGCRSHDVSTCGLHITASGDIMSYTEWEKLQAFINQHAEVFKKISRRNNFEWCEFCDEGEGRDKYRALNLRNVRDGEGKPEVDTDGTSRVEFRFFRGTLLPRSFLASMECAFSLVEFWQSLSPRSRAPTLNQYKRWIAASGYLNLQDYLFDMDLIDSPSNRNRDNAMKAKKAKEDAAREERRQRIEIYRERITLHLLKQFQALGRLMLVNDFDISNGREPIIINAPVKVRLSGAVGGETPEMLAEFTEAAKTLQLTLKVLAQVDTHFVLAGAIAHLSFEINGITPDGKIRSSNLMNRDIMFAAF